MQKKTGPTTASQASPSPPPPPSAWTAPPRRRPLRGRMAVLPEVRTPSLPLLVEAGHAIEVTGGRLRAARHLRGPLVASRLGVVGLVIYFLGGGWGGGWGGWWGFLTPQLTSVNSSSIMSSNVMIPIGMCDPCELGCRGVTLEAMRWEVTLSR